MFIVIFVPFYKLGYSFVYGCFWIKLDSASSSKIIMKKRKKEKKRERCEKKKRERERGPTYKLKL